MAYIYKITNDINDKIYIGKTEFSVEKRFQEHCKDAFKKTQEKRPLYLAMKKYGIEHFKVEQIEETDNPEVREQYWIKFYDSYQAGYNATSGGDGKRLYDYDLILDRLQKGKFACEIQEEFGCDIQVIRNVAYTNDIPLLNRSNVANRQPVSCFQFNKLIKSFDSTYSAAKWIIEENFSAADIKGVRAKIGLVARGKRKTAYGFVWKYTSVISLEE